MPYDGKTRKLTIWLYYWLFITGWLRLMADGITHHIEGEQELARALKALAKSVQGQILENAVLAGCLPIQNDAVANAPYLTGTLRRSIHSEVIERGKTSVVGMVGTDVEYAPFVEFGTSRMGARPFLRNAYDGNKNAAIKEIADALRQQIENVS